MEDVGPVFWSPWYNWKGWLGVKHQITYLPMFWIPPPPTPHPSPTTHKHLYFPFFVCVLTFAALSWHESVSGYTSNLAPWCFHCASVQVSSVQGGICALAWKSPFALNPIYQKSPQHCLWNGSTVHLIDDGPLSFFQGRLSSASSFPASLLLQETCC